MNNNNTNDNLDNYMENEESDKGAEFSVQSKQPMINGNFESCHKCQMNYLRYSNISGLKSGRVIATIYNDTDEFTVQRKQAMVYNDNGNLKIFMNFEKHMNCRQRSRI